MSIGFSEHGLKMHMEDMIMEKEEEEKEAFLVLSSNELASKQPQEYKKLLLCSCYNFRLPILFAATSSLLQCSLTHCSKTYNFSSES